MDKNPFTILGIAALGFVLIIIIISCLDKTESPTVNPSTPPESPSQSNPLPSCPLLATAPPEYNVTQEIHQPSLEPPSYEDAINYKY